MRRGELRGEGGRGRTDPLPIFLPMRYLPPTLRRGRVRESAAERERSRVLSDARSHGTRGGGVEREGGGRGRARERGTNRRSMAGCEVLGDEGERVRKRGEARPREVLRGREPTRRGGVSNGSRGPKSLSVLGAAPATDPCPRCTSARTDRARSAALRAASTTGAPSVERAEVRAPGPPRPRPCRPCAPAQPGPSPPSCNHEPPVRPPTSLRGRTRRCPLARCRRV